MKTLSMSPVSRLPSKVRFAVVVAVAAAAGVHLRWGGYADWHAGADTVYVLVLFGLFMKKEREDDERVRELKLKALFVGFSAGWAITGALRFGSYLRDRSVPPSTLSAYDALFIILLIAHALFYFWRFQDGRTLERK